MGDASDMRDIDRFMRSPEGQAHLSEIRNALVGRSIESVEFTNGIHGSDVELVFDDDGTFECELAGLDVETLRDEFEAVLEREYYKDYPERRNV